MPVPAYAKQPAGRAMGSRALEADALETWLCAYLSATFLIGLGLNTRAGWCWVDPVAARGMVPFMIWQGRSAIVEARSEETEGGAMKRSPPSDHLRRPSALAFLARSGEVDSPNGEGANLWSVRAPCKERELNPPDQGRTAGRCARPSSAGGHRSERSRPRPRWTGRASPPPR